MTSYISDVIAYVTGVSSVCPPKLPSRFFRNVLFALPLQTSVKWSTKEKALDFLSSVAMGNPDQVSHYLPEIVPALSGSLLILPYLVNIRIVPVSFDPDTVRRVSFDPGTVRRVSFDPGSVYRRQSV